MPFTPNDFGAEPDVLAAARELIHNEGDGCVVTIDELLEGLSEKLGGGFRVTPDIYRVLDLIAALWDDPHIHQPERGCIEFAWDEKARNPGAPGVARCPD